ASSASSYSQACPHQPIWRRQVTPLFVSVAQKHAASVLLSSESGHMDLRNESRVRVRSRELGAALACILAFIAASPSHAQDIQRSTLVGADHVRIGSADGPPETTFAGVVGAYLLE